MILLTLTVTTLVLLAVFLGVTSYETQHGVRFFTASRVKMDRFASRLIILFTHVDFGSFFRHLTKDIFHKVAHDLVEATLALVRFLERTLTNTMKSLRARIAPTHVAPPKGEGSHFVKTMSYFKKTIRKSHKEDVEISSPLPPVAE